MYLHHWLWVKERQIPDFLLSIEKTLPALGPRGFLQEKKNPWPLTFMLSEADKDVKKVVEHCNKKGPALSHVIG